MNNLVSFAIYNPTTGQILRHGSMLEDAIEHNTHEGEVAVLCPLSVNCESHYVSNGELIPIPIKEVPEYIFDYTTKTWIDPRTLVDHQNTKWEEIKTARTESEFSSFTWEGSVFNCDSMSQSRIQGASQLATLATLNNSPFVIDWTLADNSIRSLTAADMLAVGTAMGVHITTQHAIARNLRNLIFAATTIEELSTIAWPN